MGGAATSGDAAQPQALVDIGINIHQREMRHEWQRMLDRSCDAGVNRVVLTGVSMKSSRHNLEVRSPTAARPPTVRDVAQQIINDHVDAISC
jgi:Tat protein secretion system quality control protein TatD with DNase activity